jgi:hypothetical protein
MFYHAIFQHYHPLPPLRYIGIMSHQYDGKTIFCMEPFQQIEDHFCVFPVKIPGRFISQKYLGFIDERPRSADTLLFTA